MLLFSIGSRQQHQQLPHQVSWRRQQRLLSTLFQTTFVKNTTTTATCQPYHVRLSPRLTQQQHHHHLLRQTRTYITPHPLSEYISTCLTSTTAPHPGTNRTFTISFLGTSSGVPTKQRLTSCTLVRLCEHGYMFDVAEGVQRQLQFTTMNAGTVDAIFITHMHADHVLGLPGLLLGMSLVQKAKGYRRTVQIYGPPGLYDYIGMTFNLTMSGLESLDLDIYEMIGGDATTVFPGGSSKVRKYRSNIIRKTIPRQKDGTWVLQDIPNIPIIKAAEVAHLNGIQTFGFTVQEQEATRTINADKAIAMGLSPGRKYENLKQGKPVWNDDGTIFINPDNVLEGRPRKARKFTIVGDNYALSPAMIRLAQDSDVLVHEATMTKEQMENGDAVIRGHSSAEMAGVVAKRVNAKCLVLNHISPKMKTKPDIIDLRNRAKEACGERCHLVVAHDFLELLVPLHGFVDVGHELDEEESV